MRVYTISTSSRRRSSLKMGKIFKYSHIIDVIHEHIFKYFLLRQIELGTMVRIYNFVLFKWGPWYAGRE